MRMTLTTSCCVFLLSLIISMCNGEPPRDQQWVERAIGRDGRGNILKALVPKNPSLDTSRVLVINGARWLSMKETDSFADGQSVFAIDFPLRGKEFPPAGTAYNKGDIAALYLWRWMGTEGFGRVFVVGEHGASLKSALETHDVAQVGKIPCQIVSTPQDLETLLEIGVETNRDPNSAAVKMRKRAQRTPLEVATALSAHYGEQLKSISYIPSLAVIGRRRLGELTGSAKLNADAEAIIAPWFERDHFITGKKLPGGSTVAGYLVFVDAFDRTGHPRAKEIALQVAGVGLDKDFGTPLEVVPNHNQMSDSVFMNAPLLAAAGRLSGDERYYQACLNHIRAIQDFCLREDGLYRHSPLDAAAWGRGNGFPALGLALVLSEMPPSWPGQVEILKDFQDHMAALVSHQDATGMWHQVIDRPESYREFTCTCMITFAMLRGMRLGHLDSNTYAEPAARGWNAIKRRIGLNGRDLTDVCTGTGKQKDLEAYFLRTAILGGDERGGAMALMVATEQMFWQRDRAALE